MDYARCHYLLIFLTLKARGGGGGGGGGQLGHRDSKGIFLLNRMSEQEMNVEYAVEGVPQNNLRGLKVNFTMETFPFHTLLLF